MSETISTNISGLNLGIESVLKAPPGTLYGIRVNNFGDLGPQLSHIARSVIGPSRQRLKGSIVDIDIVLNFGFDWTFSTMARFLQGPFWNPCVDKPATAPVNGAPITVTSITSTTTFNAASGLGTMGVAGHLVRGEGYTNTANNDLHLVASGSATTVVTSGLVNETPPAGAKLTLVGHQFAAGDVEIELSGGDGLVSGLVTLISNAGAFLTGLPGVAAGETLVVGGDAEDTFFADCPYLVGRVRSIAAGAIVLDDVTALGGAAIETDDGAGMTIQIFVGGKLTNGSTMQSLHAEIQMGSGPTATQAMYLPGSVANTLAISAPGQEKMVADIGYLCLGVYERTGETGDEIISATRVTDPKEQLFNTTQDLKIAKISIANDDSIHPAFFAYDTEGSINIDNGASVAKARGVLGGIDIQTDDFMCDVSLNAYFKTISQMTSIRDNEDIQYTEFYAQANTQKGILFDVPLGTMKATFQFEKGQAIKTPLELAGCESKFGHTLMYQYYAYLPAWFAGAARS